MLARERSHMRRAFIVEIKSFVLDRQSGSKVFTEWENAVEASPLYRVVVFNCYANEWGRVSSFPTVRRVAGVLVEAENRPPS